jgi:hypothetical protein
MTDTMVGFGYKQAWLAIRDGEAAAVLEALGLHDLGEVPWRSGVDLAYLTDDRLVVTPALPGTTDPSTRWLLVAGRWFLRPDAKVDITALSATLGTEVQFFLSYRGTELHRWERAVDGIGVRRFVYLGESGEVLDWVGDPDATERALGLPEVLDVDDEEQDVLIGEHDVARVAAAWSVDPTALDGRPAPGPLTAATAP